MDGDTSTNDCVIGLASGAAGGPVISDPASPEAQQLEAAATAILQGMAKSIAWDGEGATCLIECQVTGADSKEDASRVRLPRLLYVADRRNNQLLCAINVDILWHVPCCTLI